MAKTMKKVFALLLTLSMVMSLVSLTALADDSDVVPPTHEHEGTECGYVKAVDCNCNLPIKTHAEGCAALGEPAGECNCNLKDNSHAEGCSLKASHPCAVEDVMSKIALMDVNSKASVEAARAAYDALTTDALKAGVSNYETLTNAEAAAAVATLIAPLESGSNYKTKTTEEETAFAAAVSAARTAYNALNETQKAMVTNYSLLTKAESFVGGYAYDGTSKWDTDRVVLPTTSEYVDATITAMYDKFGNVPEGNRAPKTFYLEYTILEGAPGNLDIDLSLCQLFGNYLSSPGDEMSFYITFINNSSNTYNFRDQSYQIAPYPETENFAGTNSFCDIAVPTYATCYRALNQALADLGIKSASQCTDANIYAALEERGYTGSNALARFYVDFYNEYNANNTNRVSNAKTLDDFDMYTFADIFGAKVSFSPNVLESEAEIINAHFNFLYNVLVKSTYDGSSPDYSDAIGNIMRNENGERDVANALFAASFAEFAPGDTVVFDQPIKVSIDGPLMRNSYFRYGFSFGTCFTLVREADDPIYIPGPYPSPEIPIEDPDVPTDETPDVPTDEPIDDPDVPLDEAPKTGDAFAIWLALAAMSAIGLAAVSFTTKKKEN